jgi:plastocyanin
MKAKLLIILLISLSLLVAGCVDDTETPTEENASMNDSVTDDVNDTVTDNTDDVSVEETETEDVTSDDEDEKLEITEYEGAKTYILNMENYLVQPSNITINQYDTVMWFNRNDPVRQFTLVSNEELWDNTTIGYRLSFKYTFNETGTYTYKVLGWEGRMKGTIIVK